jgi:hypothetical protein
VKALSREYRNLLKGQQPTHLPVKPEKKTSEQVSNKKEVVKEAFLEV